MVALSLLVSLLEGKDVETGKNVETVETGCLLVKQTVLLDGFLEKLLLRGIHTGVSNTSTGWFRPGGYGYRIVKVTVTLLRASSKRSGTWLGLRHSRVARVGLGSVSRPRQRSAAKRPIGE